MWTLNHFACMCNKASNEGKDKQANSVELEQETNAYCVSGRGVTSKRRCIDLYQLKEGKLQNPTVALDISMVFPSPLTPGYAG